MIIQDILEMDFKHQNPSRNQPLSTAEAGNALQTPRRFLARQQLKLPDALCIMFFCVWFYDGFIWGYYGFMVGLWLFFDGLWWF